MRIPRRISTLLGAAALSCTTGALLFAPAFASSAPKPQSAKDAAFFAREVKPILEKRCLGCHGTDSQLSNLDLRTQAAALKGGTHGAVILPGKPDESKLFQQVSGKRTPLMPPAGKLPAAEIATLKKWIQSGASYEGVNLAEAPKQVWWSFRPPVEPKVPALKDAWVKTPVDAFVLQKLRANNLQPSPEGPRRVLIRRVYMDLLGLPPTPEEIAAFEADRAPGAWEKVVDRLLASPHYGERWGRHWMDLVRYADSGGFEGDKDRPLAYRYRDYIIQSFVQDKPYDLFLKEQLAGDEVRPDDPEAWVATGYLAMTMEDFAQAKSARVRADEVDDLVSTTASAVLGLTVGCARCHDHKYDPVSQKDYFRLYAVFAPTVRKEVTAAPADERRFIDLRNAPYEREAAPLRDELAPLRAKAVEKLKAAGNASPNDDQIAAALPEGERARFNDLRGKIAALQAKRIEPPKAMVMTDAGRDFKPVKLHVRGDAFIEGDVIEPGFIENLPGGTARISTAAATPKTTGRRKALAEWITRPDHPLTARVWMNRVWRQHFGRGLVASTSNFGVNGDLPSHPELLDWLAERFVKGGWKLKPIHKTILMSSAWRQASAQRSDAMAADPENKWLWRMPVRRLEAEAIRDSMLAAAGTLNREMYGPPVYPPVDPSLRADTYQGFNWPEGEDSPKTWRRSVYVKVKRSLLFPQLEVFDCPEITYSVAARNTTTTPLQALALLNDPLILRQSALFAERLEREAGKDPKRQVERAYRLAVGRAPTARESQMSLEFLKTHPLQDFCQSILNLSEFVYVQ
jgi:hypothetical protein